MKLTIDFIILQFANSCLMVYTFLLFFSSFAGRRFNGKKHWIFTLLIIATFTSVLLFVENKIINVFLLVCLTILISSLYTLKWYNTLLLSLLGYVLGTLSEFITSSLFAVLFSLDIKTTAEGPFLILGILFSKFLTFIIVFFIRFKKQKVLYNNSLKKTLIIFLIPCATIVVLLLQYHYFMVVPELKTTSVLMTLLSYIFLISSNIIVLDILEHLYQDAEKENQLRFAEKVIESQSVQYNQLLEHNKNIQRLRHDYKNALMGLISELEQENYTQAISDLKSQLDKLQLPYNSAYPIGIIGTILNEKNEVATQNGIQIDFSHSELSQIRISEMDLAIILGNALDNAIEATQKLSEDNNNRFISVLIKVLNNQIVIVIKNPVAANVDVNNLTTTKNNSERHGFGLISMRNLVSKYEGEIALSCEDCIFQVHMVLRNQTLE